jgi:hypothetical protein
MTDCARRDPDGGGSRALSVQLAGAKIGRSRLRQIRHGSLDRGSISDSQADSAGSIPVTRSIREKRYHTGESDAIFHVRQRPSASEISTRGINHLAEWPCAVLIVVRNRVRRSLKFGVRAGRSFNHRVDGGCDGWVSLGAGVLVDPGGARVVVAHPGLEVPQAGSSPGHPGVAGVTQVVEV